MALAATVLQPYTSLCLGGYVGEPLGPLQQRGDIKSRLGPFQSFPEYRTRYPRVVVEALQQLFHEYNQVFADLVRQSGQEYPRCYLANDPESFANRWVQIDMAGLPAAFLAEAVNHSVDVVREVLRHWIYEIENSVAMYQLLQRLFPDGPFDAGFREMLQEIRQTSGMPIALLAVTDEKYEALLGDEFGRDVSNVPTDEEVMRLTGFDRLFSPQEFREYVASGGDGYLLFVRASDPAHVLRKPGTQVSRGLLDEPRMRQHIRRFSLTPNIDDPDALVRLNDTKGYMSDMGMGFAFASLEELFSARMNAGTWRKGHDPVLSDGFSAFLQKAGVSEERIQSGDVPCRFKPGQGAYGCYGHLTKKPGDIAELLRGQRGETPRLATELARRGFYVVQPERPLPVVVDAVNGRVFRYIDRVFFGVDERGGHRFLGGFRSMMEVGSDEEKRKRGHGSKDTIWAPITS